MKPHGKKAPYATETPKTVRDTSTSLALGAPAAPKPAPIVMKVPGWNTLVMRALDRETRALTKLAKENEDSGYHRAARDVTADVNAISQEIAPLFRDTQQTVPFSGEEVSAGVMNAVRGKVRQHAREKADKPGSVDHETELLKFLADRVGRWGIAVANDAYQAGLRAREDTPEALAGRRLGVLDETETTTGLVK